MSNGLFSLAEVQQRLEPTVTIDDRKVPLVRVHSVSPSSIREDVYIVILSDGTQVAVDGDTLKSMGDHSQLMAWLNS